MIMNNIEECKDIVVSTRIRLARNLKDYPFPDRLRSLSRYDEMNKIDELVRNAISKGNSVLSDKFKYIDMSKLDRTSALSLVEYHLVSPQFVEEKGGALLLIDDKSVSIMINEEDHLRIQVMKSGLSLESAYDMADKIDTLLDQELNFAFDKKLGFLTQCPTNLGTGMRASVMLHLPMLKYNKTISEISNRLSKLGFTIRGTYGEGSTSIGALYQLSNQVTLGITEKESVKNLKDVALNLIELERNLREKVKTDINVLDRIHRSYGILKNARLINEEEFMNCISNVRLGISIGEINSIDYDKINYMIDNSQSANLIKNNNMSSEEDISSKLIDEMRANFARNMLK